MVNRRFAFALVVVAGLLMAASTQASWGPMTKVNYLTFNRTVALPGVVLAPGTYAFEAGPMQTHADVVRVTTRERQRVLFMGFTVRTARPDGAGGNRLVTFGEGPAGGPVPIIAWYPVGSPTGHEFLHR